MRRLSVLVVMCALALGCQDGGKEKAPGREPATVDPPKTDPAQEPATVDSEPAPEAPAIGAPSGKPLPQDPATATATATKSKARNAREILGPMSKWLPQSTLLFLFADISAMDPQELGMGLYTIPVDFDMGPMTEELGAFLQKRIGVNLMKAEWMAAAGAVDPDFFVLFLGGDFGELDGATDAGGGLKVRALEGDEAFLVTIPGVKGLAVIQVSKHVELLSEIIQGKSPALAGTPDMARFESLIERSGPKTFLAAAQVTNPEVRDQLFSGIARGLKGFIPPNGALVGAGETILLLVQGEEASLGMIEGQFTMAKAMAKGMLDKGMAGIDQAPLPEGLGLIAAKHMWPVLTEQLTPKREGEFMWIEIQMPGGLGLVSVAGVLSAVAIPAFIKYIRKSKTGEAVETLDKLYKGAGDYYLTKRANMAGEIVECAMPSPAGPVPKAGTCCGALGGPDADGDDRCDGTEAEWNAAFGGLHVPYPGPHYYTYEIVPSENTAAPGLIIRATGDLDCDGVRSTFERFLQGQATPGRGCDLEERTALYTYQETE